MLYTTSENIPRCWKAVMHGTVEWTVLAASSEIKKTDELGNELKMT